MEATGVYYESRRNRRMLGPEGGGPVGAAGAVGGRFTVG